MSIPASGPSCEHRSFFCWHMALLGQPNLESISWSVQVPMSVMMPPCPSLFLRGRFADRGGLTEWATHRVWQSMIAVWHMR